MAGEESDYREEGFCSESGILDMDGTGIPNTAEEDLLFANKQTVEHFDNGERYAFQQ